MNYSPGQLGFLQRYDRANDGNLRLGNDQTNYGELLQYEATKEKIEFVLFITYRPGDKVLILLKVKWYNLQKDFTRLKRCIATEL